jgi:serine O-acetyltransferase
VSTSVTQLTEQLLASYARVGGINHLDGKNMPSKTAVAAITVDLLRLLYPGFFDDKIIHSSEMKAGLGNLLESVSAALEREICKALEYGAPQKTTRKKLCPEAHALTTELLKGLPRLRELLRTDVEAAFSGDPAAMSQDEIILAYPCVEAITVQRIAHEFYQKRIPLIPRIMTEWAHIRTGMDLHPGANIGTHFFVDHCTGTVVGETCDIGHHVKMYHGVTLGAKSTSDVESLRGRKRHPTLEDYVTIYPGATILGGETVIGAHSTIGGNVFLTNSVPPYSLAVLEGVKVKVMSKRERTPSPVEYEI